MYSHSHQAPSTGSHSHSMHSQNSASATTGASYMSSISTPEHKSRHRAKSKGIKLLITSRERPHGNQGVLRRYFIQKNSAQAPIDPVDRDHFCVSRLRISISTIHVGVFYQLSCQSILYFSKYFPYSRAWHVQGSEEVIESRLESVQIWPEGNKTGPSPGLRASDQVKIPVPALTLQGLICSR